ncbi:hypothetical protein BVE25_003566, partial [Salmonella enterica subsp. enterica]|nr:hypothetical protein [Salmonella enterica subsp. enterica]
MPCRRCSPLPARGFRLSAGGHIYFWIFRQFMEEKELTKPLARLVYTNLKTAR